MLYTKGQVKELDGNSFTAVASSEVVDRQGEVIEQAGWMLKNYKDNPILLFMHDHTKPIGKATRVWLDKAVNQLKFKGVLSDATEWGRAAKQLMEEGILSTFSVGFQTQEMEGNRITKAELHEISLVSVPANPQARLQIAKSLEKAGIEESVIKDFTKENDSETIRQLQEQLAEAEKASEEANKTAQEALEKAEIAVKGLQHLNPHRSNTAVVSKRLHLAKVMAKAADKLIVESKSPKTVDRAKLMKVTSEKLISHLKGDLKNGST